ncbi:hypothetical protein [Endozoicomonas arenosclerae]|uniref:hypothetical protein n=1 Tax=Endozoicomonas arenosclerae TaxID=1633495 RepID=UPI000B145695|nr:hypothetical protein [Endozoicomonas arenosclerae]
MPAKDVFGSVQDALFGSTQKNSTGVQTAEMADARQGILYFLANTDTIPMPKPLSVGGATLEGIFGKTDFIHDLSSFSRFAFNNTLGHTSVGQTLSGITTATAHFAQKIDQEVSGFFSKVIEKLASFFGKFSNTVASMLRSLTPTALSGMVGGILSQIPGWNYVKSSSAIYSAFRMSVTNCYSFISQLWSGRDVKLLKGHPDIISNALARHSLASVAGGVKDMAVQGTLMGLKISGDLAGMAGTLVSIISSAILSVLRMLEGMIQKHLLKKVLNRASEEWKIRESSRSIIYNHQAFSEWFRKAVIPCPIIASLALNSGFAAHPFRFLKLLSNDGDVSSDRSFAKGVKHIEHLKKSGKDYIRQYTRDYELRFIGKDELVSARLNDLVLGKAFATPPPEFAYKPIRLTKVTTPDGQQDWVQAKAV